MIDAQKTPVTGPLTAAPEDTTLLDASRWAIWQTLARGLAHSLANAAQLLLLDPPPPGVLAEARARVSRAHALMLAAGRPAEGSASFLPAVLADFDALQQLQVGLPAARLAITLEEPLPMAAVPEADVLHVLLLIATRLKQACAANGLEIGVRAHCDGAMLRVAVEPGAAAAAPLSEPSRAAPAALLEASAVLLTRAGGELRESDAGWELALPVLRR